MLAFSEKGVEVASLLCYNFRSRKSSVVVRENNKSENNSKFSFGNVQNELVCMQIVFLSFQSKKNIFLHIHYSTGTCK